MRLRPASTGYAYVLSEMEFDGQRITNVGLRFKGSSSYVVSAGTLRRPEQVGPWLHGVARRTAAKARASAVRRRHAPMTDIPAAPARDDLLWRDLNVSIDRTQALERVDEVGLFDGIVGGFRKRDECLERGRRSECDRAEEVPLRGALFGGLCDEQRGLTAL